MKSCRPPPAVDRNTAATNRLAFAYGVNIIPDIRLNFAVSSYYWNLT